MKCQSLSSLTVEIALKRRRQAINYQCWCGVNFPRDLKCQILSSLTLEIAFKRRKGFCGCGPKLDKDLTAVEEIRLVIFTMFSHRKVQTVSVFISLIRMRSKRDIKMGRLCTPGGAVLGIVGGGVRFRFLNGEAIFQEYMLFWVRLYALVVVLKILLDFSL